MLLRCLVHFPTILEFPRHIFCEKPVGMVGMGMAGMGMVGKGTGTSEGTRGLPVLFTTWVWVQVGCCRTRAIPLEWCPWHHPSWSRDLLDIPVASHMLVVIL